MSHTLEAKIFYEKNLQNLAVDLKKLKQYALAISWLRFATVIIFGTLIYISWQNTTALFITSIALTGVILFLFLLHLNSTNFSKQQFVLNLIFLNKEELLLLNHDYYHREDGSKYCPVAHAYAADLDLFGKASLFQYINRCTSEQGEKLLAQNLLNAQPNYFIQQQQQATKQLIQKPSWMQDFLALGIDHKLNNTLENKIKDWLQQTNTYFTNTNWQWFIYVYRIITASTLILYLFDIIPTHIFYTIVLVCFLFAFNQSKKASKTYNQLSKIVPQISTLQKQIQFFEQHKFSNSYFQYLLQLLQNNSYKASNEIKSLQAILQNFDLRLNAFAFFFLNTFLLWDVQQMLALNKWKQKNKQHTPQWFDIIAQVEVSISLALFSFNNPSFCYPTISEKYFEFQATDLGHPLIKKEHRVCSSFSQFNENYLALVTGSNMGGKSTFLRSVGINTVLALMGATTCATSFTITPVELMSSMRIADNLAENTSTFYAELKKLKVIIEAMQQHKKVFILLDEILRGTNSLDRHIGSKALIEQMIQSNRFAIIATHDVELAKLATAYPTNIINYHFDVQVENNELYFDYKLKQGVCTSLNASILMKKIGINI